MNNWQTSLIFAIPMHFGRRRERKKRDKNMLLELNC